MSRSQIQSILPGLTLDSQGTASIDARLSRALIDLAIELEAAVPEPVDVEHVVAAIVLAWRAGEIDSQTPLEEIPDRHQLLGKQLRVLFSR